MKAFDVVTATISSAERGLPRRGRQLLGRVAQTLFRRAVLMALALSPRGFVSNDRLRLCTLSARLRLEWQTRDVHPWDDDLPGDRQATRFCEQTLLDTETALVQCFEMLPQIEAIDLRVLEPREPNRLLLAGTVERGDVMTALALSSPAMRLRMLGVQCQIRDGRLEPIE
jgi:hypothetical protein